MTSERNKSAEALSPCPFCGGPAEIEQGIDHQGAWYSLGCSRHWGRVNSGAVCKPGPLWFASQEADTPLAEAIAAWNTRAPLVGVEAGEEGKSDRLPQVPASGAASGWMSIETAPKDGTWFLGHWPERADEWEAVPSSWNDDTGRFIDLTRNDDFEWDQPKMWMPLPALSSSVDGLDAGENGLPQGVAGAAEPALVAWSDQPHPTTGEWLVVRHQTPFRYLHYKPASEQRRRGILGRWQRMSEYGHWENSEPPVGDWRLFDAVSPALEGKSNA